ncbi:MAG: hypothetical protein ABJH45_09605 [Paracoccaceae bacterium]
MPDFNRRGFLQLAGAAGITPLLPALPMRAVAATTSASTSKALWAGIYTKSGSVPKFVEAARGMGLSNTAIQGVSARSAGIKIALSTATSPITRMHATTRASLPSQAKGLKADRNLLRNLEGRLPFETDETNVEALQGTETQASETGPKVAQDSASEV